MRHLGSLHRKLDRPTFIIQEDSILRKYLL